MQTSSKIKALWIAVTMLAVLNVTTIGTIVYHNQQEREEIDNIVISPDEPPISGRYFRQQLDFDNSQMDVFRGANQKFRRSASDFIISIERQKELLFAELQSAEPDRENIVTISAQIGSMHARLKEATAEFYMTLSAVCDAQQKESMKTIFTPLFRQTPNIGASRGQGHEQRHGYGRDSINQ
jgi:hypothetical protein